jgi:putative Holliday junction resolvase
MNTARAGDLQPPARVLGFDYGARRIGVAAGQAFTGTAQALAVVGNGANGPDWVRLEALVKDWNPEAFVIGRALTEAGEEQAVSRAAGAFAKRLAQRFGRPVHAQDERLSSREADQRFALARRMGTRRARDASQLDALAAQIIVEDFYASWRATPQGERNAG